MIRFASPFRRRAVVGSPASLSLRAFILHIFVGIIVASSLGSCRKERKVDVASRLDPAGMPTMSTLDVSTLISDSGVTQYKMVSHEWYVYNEVDTPYWLFPKGLYLEKFDRKFRVIASVAADSALYLVKEKLWKLMGNVEVKKQPRDLFLSERLYWNERERKVYSDTFIHIENDTHVLEGSGFVSNDQMTVYRVLKPNGIFPVDRDALSGPAPGSQIPGTPVAPRGASMAASASIPMPVDSPANNGASMSLLR